MINLVGGENSRSHFPHETYTTYSLILFLRLLKPITHKKTYEVDVLAVSFLIGPISNYTKKYGLFVLRLTFFVCDWYDLSKLVVIGKSFKVRSLRVFLFSTLRFLLVKKLIAEIFLILFN